MSDLTEFLLARIEVDEAFWTAEVNDLEIGNVAERILAECEAKRRIVEEHPMLSARQSRVSTTLSGDPAWVEGCCSTCTAGGEYGGCDPRTGELSYCETLLALAAVYADHPDYRDEWRP